jgi:hypothetical protein
MKYTFIHFYITQHPKKNSEFIPVFVGIELIEELSGNNDFQNLISVSDKRLRESFDKELVLRFFALSYCPNKFKEYGGAVKTSRVQSIE